MAGLFGNRAKKNRLADVMGDIASSRGATAGKTTQAGSVKNRAQAGKEVVNASAQSRKTKNKRTGIMY